MSGADARVPFRERLLGRYYVAESGCWEWSGPLTMHGYGYLSRQKKKVMAHRATYEMWCGPIPEGLELDHLCKNRACGRPDHLEPVTHRENVRRGDALSGKRSRQTHCHRGHPLSGENLRINKNGSRSCRTCHRELERTRLARRASAAAKEAA